MQQVLNKGLLFYGLLFLGLFWANITKAVCPVCVITVGTGVGLCRWLGIDDTISGLWIGALVSTMAIWTYLWMEKKGWTFKLYRTVVWLAYYLLIFAPLYFYDIVGHSLNKIFGVDKLIFGITFGTVVFLLGHWLNLFLKKKNNGKVYFYYQKVIIPIVLLITASFIFYLIIKCQ